MKTPPSILNLECEAIQKAHEFLNSYYWGSFEQALAKEQLYPLMCSFYTRASGSTALMVPINLFFVIADKLYKSDSNLNHTESDTLQIAKDIVNVLKKSPRWQKIGRVNSWTAEKFYQKGKDETAGHVLQVNISLRDSDSICGLPMSDYDFEGNFSASCAPVTVENSDGTVSYSVSSGGTFVVTDTVITFTVNGSALPPVNVKAFTDEQINLVGSWQT